MSSKSQTTGSVKKKTGSESRVGKSREVSATMLERSNLDAILKVSSLYALVHPRLLPYHIISDRKNSSSKIME